MIDRLINTVLLKDLDGLGATLHSGQMHPVSEGFSAKATEFPSAGSKIYYATRAEQLDLMPRELKHAIETPTAPVTLL